jgi:hypothetical protein
MLRGIECSEPGLSETRGQDDDSPPEALLPGFVEGGKRCPLNSSRLGRRFLFMAAGCNRSRRRDAPLLVGLDPRVRQGNRPS